MKKLLALMLAAALALSLVACGGGGGAGDNNTPSTPSTSSGGNEDTTPPETENVSDIPSKEELLQSATEITRNELYEARIFENVLKGDDYLNNTYTYMDFVRSIETEYVIMSSVVNDNIIFKVYLDREELKTLNVGEKVTVVGIVDSIEKQDDLTAIVTMKTARFVTNRSTVTGTIDQITAFDHEPYCLLFGVTAVFLERDIIETLTEGEKITVEGVMSQWNGLEISRPYKYEMRDAKLVE